MRLEVLLISTMMCFPPLSALAQSPVVGDWEGSVKVDSTNLHLVLHIRQAVDGTLSALLDSIDQDASGVPVNAVSFTGANLSLNIAQVSATYSGVLSKDGNELKGVWTEGKHRNLTFKRVLDASILVTPEPIGGDWVGMYDDGGVQKDVHLHINTTSCTTIVGTVDIPAVSKDGIQIPKVTFQSGTLKFSVESLHANYSGKLKDNHSEFEGVWKQGETYPLTLRRATRPYRLYEPPKGCRGEAS